MSDGSTELNVIEADLKNITHAAAVIDLLSAYALDPMGGGEALSAYTQMHLVAELASRDTALVILAFDNAMPVGLLIGFEGFSTFACKPLLNIHDVVVVSHYRGQGIAGRMLKKVEELARSRDYCKLTLEVLEGNAPAQSAYQSSGFVAYQLDPAMGPALFWEKKLD
ncbi:MAG: GNAT family N-acetyltransferase [Gammaproteobacteria bacterium]|nr:GNAT family N-acetyltransferase [Gammaproteobacteria bacterium]